MVMASVCAIQVCRADDLALTAGNGGHNCLSSTSQTPGVGMFHTHNTITAWKTPCLISDMVDLDEFRSLPNWSQLCPTTNGDQDQTALPASARTAPDDLQTVGLPG